jgi:flagellar biosynthesis chaperone FliJ
VTAPARWPLAILLELAQRKEEDAAAALGDALARVAACTREREEASGVLAAHRSAAREASRLGVCAGAAIGTLAARARHLARLGEEEERLRAALARREARIAAAEEEVARRRDERGAARAATRVLEERREAWQTARRRVRERAEEDAADEVVSARRRGGS